MTSPRIAFEAAKKPSLLAPAVAMTGGLSGCVTTQGSTAAFPISSLLGSPVMLGTYHAVNPSKAVAVMPIMAWQLAPNSTATLVHDNRNPSTPHPLNRAGDPVCGNPIDN